MSRVIRGHAVEDAPLIFGGGSPRSADAYWDDILARARTEAFEQGRREGYDQGRADMASAALRVERGVESALAELPRRRDASAVEALDAAFAVAEFVLGHAPHDNGATLTARIQQALAQLDDDDLVISVHHGDAAVLADALRLPAGATIQPDRTLAEGEARIRGTWASATLTRDAALSVAREVLS